MNPVIFFKIEYPELKNKIIDGDFLKLDLNSVFPNNFSIIGNFLITYHLKFFLKHLKIKI